MKEKKTEMKTGEKKAAKSTERAEREDKSGAENGSKARNWKVDVIMGIVIVAVGLPFFAVDYKAAGIVMAVIGAFCIVSGLCQKVVKGEKER